MEWLNEIWLQVAEYVSVPYLLTFMLLAYLVKYNFGKALQKITKFDWKPVFTVLIIATLVAIPYLIWSDETWVKILFSYAVGTSLHEIILTHIEKMFK
jgi:hypothetical protein